MKKNLEKCKCRWDHSFLKDTVTFLSQNYDYYTFLSIGSLTNAKLRFCNGNVNCLKNINNPIVDTNF